MGIDSLFWRVKAVGERIPGAFHIYKFLTSRTGEGMVYEIAEGPLKGLKWKRYNALPYWYHRGMYEPQITAYIQSHLPSGAVFWDIGAHAGYHAITAARAVGPAGKVLAVEPDPAICQILEEQLSLNGITNCIVLQTAVADKDGATQLFVSRTDSRTSAIAEVGGHGEPLSVPVTTLDKLCGQYPPPMMMKMDIEGAELFALPGAEDLFSSPDAPQHVLLGVHGPEAEQFSTGWLLAHGYELINSAGFDPHVTLVAVKATRPKYA
jgi:FkbM family methyltransferase